MRVLFTCFFRKERILIFVTKREKRKRERERIMRLNEKRKKINQTDKLAFLRMLSINLSDRKFFILASQKTVK